MEEHISVVRSWIVDASNLPEERTAIGQLAMLNEFDYERVRIPAAQALGFRVAFVDKLRKEILKDS